MKAQIVTENFAGAHNTGLRVKRLKKEGAYKDLSTICLIPTRGQIAAKVVQSWMGLMAPMNQKFTRMFIMGMEVGAAYEQAIEHIIQHPELSTWKYILTLEEDNMPPPDGLLKLYESIDGGVDGKKYDCVGGLYWTKGEGGQPMIYGDPNTFPKNFAPQVPLQDTVQLANGLGMGFNLFRMSIFKDGKLGRPWFKTLQEFSYGKGASCFTQDLYFYEHAGKQGYRFACDTRVKVGHYDLSSDTVW